MFSDVIMSSIWSLCEMEAKQHLGEVIVAAKSGLAAQDIPEALKKIKSLQSSGALDSHHKELSKTIEELEEKLRKLEAKVQLLEVKGNANPSPENK
jgi:polyhydroxyalkanoate synthesis regulator phasin